MFDKKTNVTPITQPTLTVAEQVRAEIEAVAAKASSADKKNVVEMIKKATNGEFSSEVRDITPPMAAILFLEHNPHNRDWRPDGLKSAREYARRMNAGLWKKNNATIGFYIDGQLEDGQHRLSGAAIAGHTLEIVVVYGIHREAIVTVDDLLTRHGSDHAKLGGVANASVKQTIVKMAAAYLVKVGVTTAALRSEAEIHDCIRANNEVLNEAIEIGTNSSQNIVDPVLKGVMAQSLAYLMLQHKWPAQRIKEKLALFQTGFSMDGEKTPFFVAAELIKKAHDKTRAKERLTTARELGIALYAMISAERGVKAMNSGALKGAVQKTLPNPTYPSDAVDQAA